jgi:hypothetical protein
LLFLGVHTTGRLGGGFWCGHVALAVEVASRINDEARRVNVSQYDAVFFNLKPLGGMDVSFYFSRDADEARADLPIHFTLIVNHDGAFTANLTLEASVDADQAGRDLHFSLNLHAKVQPPDPVTGEIGQLTPPGLSKAEWHRCLPPESSDTPIMFER